MTTVQLLTLLGLLAQPVAPSAGADDRHLYRPLRATSPETATHIELPYTLGTHQFVVSEIRGSVTVDGDRFQALAGRLSVPLTALDARKPTLECHTREALGLDYTKSKFPGEHVCDGDVLPSSGNNAVVFPEITFELKSARPLGDVRELGLGKSLALEVLGRWTIHGVTRDATLRLDITPAAGPPVHPTAFRVTGLAQIRLRDYGVQVKRAFFISAGDEATIRLNLVLAQSQ